MHHYSIQGLQEPTDVNVFSLEQRTSKDCTLMSGETGNIYRVIDCGEPVDTKQAAAILWDKGTITLRVRLEHKGPGYPVCPVHKVKMLDTTEWDLIEFPFKYCPEAGCDRRYSKETGHVTTDDLPSRNQPL
jgi:hypothetical protein